ncbi:MAG: DUF58 domain-containing protein [Bdellovibrionales bacterium]
MQKPAELLRQTKLLEIRTRRLVDSVISGEYKTAFRGQGMTFSDFREYVAGDDIRHISWPLMARTGKPYIKKFDEERELQILLVVDISGSTAFGSGAFSKREKLVQVAATLALSAVRNGDEVGLVLFTDFMEHYLPPQKGRGQIQRLLRDLAFFEPQHSKTRITAASDFLQGVLKKKSVVFILSDFMDQDYSRSLSLLGKKHDVIACVIDDDFEVEMPNLGLLEVFDPESEEQLLVDSGSREFLKSLKKLRDQEQKEREKELKSSQVDLIQLSNQKDFYKPIVQFFSRRGRRS